MLKCSSDANIHGASGCEILSGCQMYGRPLSIFLHVHSGKVPSTAVCQTYWHTLYGSVSVCLHDHVIIRMMLPSSAEPVLVLMHSEACVVHRCKLGAMAQMSHLPPPYAPSAKRGKLA